MTYTALDAYLSLIDYTVLAAACLWNIGRGLIADAMLTGGPTLDRAANPVGFWLAALLQLAIFAEALFLLFTLIS